MIQLTLEHQGRELLNGIALLRQCLRLPTATAVERRGWWLDIRQSRAELAALYLGGLRRDFRQKPAVYATCN